METSKPDDRAWAEVGRASYVSFTSYRKNGTPVSTPVWIAPDGENLYFLLRHRCVQGQAGAQQPGGHAPAL